MSTPLLLPLWSTVMLTVFLSVAPAEQAEGLCEGNQATLGCLKNHFRKLARSNQKQFWYILRSAEENALTCRSLHDTADYLEIAGIIEGAAEASEYFSEVLETKLIPSHAICFLNALIIANKESQIRILVDLRHPTFTDEEVIGRVLSKYRRNPKYKDVLTIYYNELALPNISITRDKAIEVATDEAVRLGYGVQNMAIEVGQDNRVWNEHLASLEKNKMGSDEYMQTLNSKLTYKQYWAVYLRPKQITKKGGDLFVFVDATSGKVLATYRGK